MGEDPMKLGRRAFMAGGLASLVAPLPLSAAPLAKVRELGTLRVAVYKHNRPWSWSEPDGNTNLRGIDVDLAGALAKALNVKLDIQEFTAGDDMATDLRNAVWRGGLLGFKPADVMMHVPFDRQLMVENDQCAILAPYYRESFAAACGPEQNDCDVPAPQYRGRRMAAAVATIPDIYLLSSFGGALRSSVTHFNTGHDAVLALGTGQADVAVATKAEVEAGIFDMKNPGIKARKRALEAIQSPGWDIGMAVKENSRSLGDAIEGIIGRMSNDGQMKAIFGAYGVEWRPAISA